MFASAELEKFGISVESIEEKMKSDVIEKVRNMVASGLQDDFVFASGEYDVQDPTNGIMIQL